MYSQVYLYSVQNWSEGGQTPAQVEELLIIYLVICDPLSENLALPANIKFELEAILSVQVVFQLNSDYCTKMLQGACTVSY